MPTTCKIEAALNARIEAELSWMGARFAEASDLPASDEAPWHYNV